MDDPQVVTKKPKISTYVNDDIKELFEQELKKSDASSASEFLETFLGDHLGAIGIRLDEGTLKKLKNSADKDMRSLEQQAAFLLTRLLDQSD